MVFSGLNNKEFFDLEIFVDGQDGSLVINDNVSFRILDFTILNKLDTKFFQIFNKDY